MVSIVITLDMLHNMGWLNGSMLAAPEGDFLSARKTQG